MKYVRKSRPTCSGVQPGPKRSRPCCASWSVTAPASSPVKPSWPMADWTPADMTTELKLPHADGSLTIAPISDPAPLVVASTPPTSRDVYAAAHVVADPLRASADSTDAHIDWDATLRLRHQLWE